MGDSGSRSKLHLEDALLPALQATKVEGPDTSGQAPKSPSHHLTLRKWSEPEPAKCMRLVEAEEATFASAVSGPYEAIGRRSPKVG